MSASTTAMTSSTSAYTTPAFWERLWRTAGIQSLGLFIIGYVIYGYQPHIGASADALAAFYDGDRTRILIAAVFFGLSILNLKVRCILAGRNHLAHNRQFERRQEKSRLAKNVVRSTEIHSLSPLRDKKKARLVGAGTGDSRTSATIEH